MTPPLYKSWFELITHTPHREQTCRMRWIIFQFLAQPPYVNGHRARVNVLCASPNAIEQLLTGKDLFGMPRQQIEHVEFLCCQFDFGCAHLDNATQRVNA